LKAQELATIATPTRTLPNRVGRNVHPAGLPKSRRRKEEVEAEREAKKKALEEKTRKEQVAKEHLAQMNLSEECEDDLPHQHPPRLSVMIRKRRHVDNMETDSDESFDLGEADDRLDSDLDMDEDTDSRSESLKVAKTTQVRV
jgi:seryl-tRNA synthetase